MAYSQADIDNLEQALATGAESVMVEGRMIKFRSVAEIELILNRAREQVNAGTSRRKPKAYRFNVSKGL